jgi:hypothetical protein
LSLGLRNNLGKSKHNQVQDHDKEGDNVDDMIDEEFKIAEENN